MNTDNADNNLRQLFHVLRKQDAERAPDFDKLARIREPQRSFALPWTRLAAAAAIVLVLGLALAVFITRSHQSAPDLREWAALSSWRASTDTLLIVSNTCWGSKVTTPTDSLMDTGSCESDKSQGDRKENL